MQQTATHAYRRVSTTLHSVLGDRRRLQIFLKAGCEGTAALYAQLPGEAVSPDRVFDAAARLVLRQGHTAAVFDALVALAPERANELRADRDQILASPLTFADLYEDPGVASRSRRAELALLAVVHDAWVVDYLEDATTRRGPWLEVNSFERPDVIAAPVTAVPEVGASSATPTSAYLPMIHRFDASHRRLLVLGAPGSGKTIALLDLTRALISRAHADPNALLPVVLNLSSFKGTSLDDWVVEQLNHRYSVRKDQARRWLTADRLALILDGLDEVVPSRRQQAAAAINVFCARGGHGGLAVSCRTSEHEQLPVRLSLRLAVELQALDPAQVNAFVSRGPGQPVRDLLDGAAGLRDLARTPLMLNVITVAYGPDFGAPDATVEAAATTRERVFHRYVDRMLVRRPAAAPFLPRLTRLARLLQRQGKTELWLEDLQPTWLGPIRLHLYLVLSRVCLAALFAVVCVLVRSIMAGEPNLSSLVDSRDWRSIPWALGLGGAAGGLEVLRYHRRRAASQSRSSSVISHAAMVAGAFAIVVGLVTLFRGHFQEEPPRLDSGVLNLVFLASLFFLRGLGRGHDEDVRLAERFRWDWRRCLLGTPLVSVVVAVAWIGATTHLRTGVSLWRPTSGERVGTYGHLTGVATTAALLPDDTHLVVGGEKSLSLIDWRAGSLVSARVAPYTKKILVSPSGNRLLSFQEPPGLVSNWSVTLWAVGAGEEGATIAEVAIVGSGLGTGAPIFSADGTRFLLRHGHLDVALRDATDGHVVRLLPTFRVVVEREFVQRLEYVFTTSGKCVVELSRELGGRTVVPVAHFNALDGASGAGTIEDLLENDPPLSAPPLLRAERSSVRIVEDGFERFLVRSLPSDHVTMEFEGRDFSLNEDGSLLAVVDWRIQPRTLSARVLILGLCVMILGGFTWQTKPERQRFGEGLRRGTVNAVSFGLVTGVILTSVEHMVSSGYLLTPWLPLVVQVQMFIGLTLKWGFLGFVYAGGFDRLQHLMIRVLLAAGGELPLRLGALLQSATERLFMRRVGGGYIFIHSLLADHLATRAEQPAVRSRS